MRTVILACRVLEKELGQIMGRNGLDYPIIWFESLLHDRPQELYQRLDAALKEVQAERVLMTFGQCGGCTDGLIVPVAELITPRVDDCITMLLGSAQRRQALNSELRAYYLTEGWLDKRSGGLSGFDHIFARYGEGRGKRIIHAMYHNYCTLCLIDTGVSDMQQLEEQCKPIAELSETDIVTTAGTTQWLEQLITGPWDTERFLIRKKGEQIHKQDFF